MLATAQENGRNQSIQMSTDCLFSGDMVHICSGEPETSLINWTTAGASATFLDWSKVLGEMFATQIDGTRRDNRITKALVEVSTSILKGKSDKSYRCACRPDTVKHVSA